MRDYTKKTQILHRNLTKFNYNRAPIDKKCIKIHKGAVFEKFDFEDFGADYLLLLLFGELCGYDFSDLFFNFFSRAWAFFGSA